MTTADPSLDQAEVRSSLACKNYMLDENRLSPAPQRGRGSHGTLQEDTTHGQLSICRNRPLQHLSSMQCKARRCTFKTSTGHPVFARCGKHRAKEMMLSL